MKINTNANKVNLKTDDKDKALPNSFNTTLKNEDIEEIDWEEFFSGLFSERENLNVEEDFLVTDISGGNQGNLANSARSIDDENVQKIVHSYYKDATDEDISLLLYRLNSCGCGYTAAINTTFMILEKRPELIPEFEKRLGYKLKESGFSSEVIGEIEKINYDYLLLDFFLYYAKEIRDFETIEDAYGNVEEEIKISQGDSALSDVEFEKEGMEGTYLFEVCDAFEKYWDDKGLNFLGVDAVSRRDFNIDKAREILKDDKKELIIACSDFDMYYYDSGEQYGGEGYKVGSHAMTVVGVKDDKLVVSSWGKKYLVEPEEVNNYSVYTYSSDFFNLLSYATEQIRDAFINDFESIKG